MQFDIFFKDTKFQESVLKKVQSISKRSCMTKDGGVYPSYATKYAKNKAEIIFIARHDSKAVGFILANMNGVNEIYLAVICSDPGMGGPLIDFFLKYADDRNLSVSLEAMPNVLGFYSKDKYGFQFRQSCSPNAQVIDASPIVGRKLNGALTDDSVFSKFIEQLQEHGFNKQKNGNCNKKNLKASEILENHCENDGYTMFRCGQSKGHAKGQSKGHAKAPLRRSNRIRRSISRLQVGR